MLRGVRPLTDVNFAESHLRSVILSGRQRGKRKQSCAPYSPNTNTRRCSRKCSLGGAKRPRSPVAPKPFLA